MKNVFLFLLMGLGLLAISSCEDSETPSSIESGPSPDQETQTTPDMPQEKPEPIYVIMNTSKGEVTIELDPERAPLTVANFLEYVDSGFYEGTIFHRVIPDFMIQGGGFTPDGERKETRNPIMLESKNGLSNLAGTIAMARTEAPNSATSQFFINVQNNTNLDYAPGNAGYAVFGRVTSGMDVVNAIRLSQTTVNRPHFNWPVEPVIIHSIRREE
jgi:cyclophilin family peptidyl-prolyl cis-trans isomerase